MKIGVYVGSFNPVHKGHMIMANYIVDNNLVDKLLVIPTGNYWDKKDLASLEDRTRMLRFYETDKIIIDNEFSNLQYTYLVINELKKEYKNDELYLIIGADNIILFDKWKHYEDLLKLELIIVQREDIDIEYFLRKLGKTQKVVIINDIVGFTVSSTLARNNIDNPEVLKEYLDQDVIEYILQRKLYRA